MTQRRTLRSDAKAGAATVAQQRARARREAASSARARAVLCVNRDQNSFFFRIEENKKTNRENTREVE